MTFPCYGRRFLSSFSHLFLGIKYLLVTSLPFSPSVTQVVLFCETMSVKLFNTSDFSAVPVLPAKAVALMSLPPPTNLGKVLGSMLCCETIGDILLHLCVCV